LRTVVARELALHVHFNCTVDYGRRYLSELLVIDGQPPANLIPVARSGMSTEGGAFSRLKAARLARNAKLMAAMKDGTDAGDSALPSTAAPAPSAVHAPVPEPAQASLPSSETAALSSPAEAAATRIQSAFRREHARGEAAARLSVRFEEEQAKRDADEAARTREGLALLEA
jgi:hypothetical protein